MRGAAGKRCVVPLAGVGTLGGCYYSSLRIPEGRLGLTVNQPAQKSSAELAGRGERGQSQAGSDPSVLSVAWGNAFPGRC